MKKNQKHKKMAILIGVAIAILTPYIIFLCRPPVIIVTDMASVLLCGKDRIKRESAAAAFALYRPVKTVIIADDAGDDIVPFSIAEASGSPYCVIFPLRFTRSARQYRDLNPDIPIVILEGRYGENSNPALTALGGSGDGYFIYKTDINADFYGVGLASYILGGRSVVFLEPGIQRQGREAFLRAINTQENPPEIVFLTSFTQYSDIPDLSCVVLAGLGIEFLESDSDIPIVLFSWIDPNLTPNKIVLILDDSPWTQAAQAVRMAAEGAAEGQISSKFIFKNNQKISRKALRNLQK
jgi:hypothetical protein